MTTTGIIPGTTGSTLGADVRAAYRRELKAWLRRNGATRARVIAADVSGTAVIYTDGPGLLDLNAYRVTQALTPLAVERTLTTDVAALAVVVGIVDERRVPTVAHLRASADSDDLAAAGLLATQLRLPGWSLGHEFDAALWVIDPNNPKQLSLDVLQAAVAVLP